jgi:ribosome maturation factor RimP
MATHISDIFQQYCYDIVQKYSCAIVEFVVRGTAQRPVVEIYIDSRDGVTLEMCADISRSLSEYVDATNSIEGNYRLDVSSPGVDRPLVYIWQYIKHIQRHICITQKDDTIIRGVLLSVDEENMTIHIKVLPDKKAKKNESEMMSLQFDLIREAVIEITL